MTRKIPPKRRRMFNQQMHENCLNKVSNKSKQVLKTFVSHLFL